MRDKQNARVQLWLDFQVDVPTFNGSTRRKFWPNGCDAGAWASVATRRFCSCACLTISLSNSVLLSECCLSTDHLDMVVHTLSLLAPDVWQPAFNPVLKDKGFGGRQVCYLFIEYSNIPSFRKDVIRNDLEYDYPGQKKRTIIEIRGEKNAVPRVISCSISAGQVRSATFALRWSRLILHVEQRSSCRESRGWFFFLSSVVVFVLALVVSMSM